MRASLVFVPFVLWQLAGCTPTLSAGGGKPTPTPGPLDGLQTIEVMPATATLATNNGASATADFAAIGHYLDGHTTDVTALVGWSLSDASLGTLASGHYTSTALRGGTATVTAAAGAIAGSATIDLTLRSTRVSSDDGSTAPADSASRFPTGTSDATLAPALAYPLDGALVPANLGELEVQWTPGKGAADLYRVHLVGDRLDLAIYTNAAAGRVSLSPAEWSALAATLAGGAAAITVAARSAGDPTKFGESAPASLAVGKDGVEGGIYYWSSSTGGTGEGIKRHSFGDVTGMAMPWITEAQAGMFLGSPSPHCVACHVLSRDGTRVAVTFDGGDGVAALVDVATQQQVIPASAGLHWNFGTLSPDGKRMVASSHGTLTLYDVDAGGVVLGTVPLPAGTRGTHPDWSPDGQKLAYVAVPAASYSNDWTFTGGSIYVAPFSGKGFGAGTPLVASSGENNYYPSFSPDNAWVLFNRSHGDAYDNADAALWVTAADGKSPPVHLARAEAPGGMLTDSWARWSPFVQPNGPHGALLYFTFSSKRDYGIELVAQMRPQIWMAAFDPKSPDPDPSSPPFWLPFQESATSNHIAQWTTMIVGVQ